MAESVDFLSIAKRAFLVDNYQLAKLLLLVLVLLLLLPPFLISFGKNRPCLSMWLGIEQLFWSCRRLDASRANFGFATRLDLRRLKLGQ